MPRSIPPPPRALMFGLAVVTAFSFLGGAALHHLHSGRPNLTNRSAKQAALFEVRITMEDQEGALRLKKEYEEKGYRVAAQNIQSTVQVPSGYIVADYLDPIAAKPAADALTQVYHFQVALKSDPNKRTLVQVGPVFEKKEDAEKLAQKLKQLGYDWHVETHFSSTPGIETELRIFEIPERDAMILKDSLSNKNITVELTSP